jgi:hypothetical protein
MPLLVRLPGFLGRLLAFRHWLTHAGGLVAVVVVRRPLLRLGPSGLTRRSFGRSDFRCTGERIGNCPEFGLVSTVVGGVGRGQLNPDRITGTAYQKHIKNGPK